MYLKVKATLQDFEFKRLKQETATNLAGINNAHNVPVIDSDGEFKNAGLEPDKILLKAQKDNNRDEILCALGVPPIMLSFLSGMETYNNSEIQVKTFWQNTMKPKLKKIQDVFNRSIFWKQNMEVRFDYSEIAALKEDELKKAQTAEVLVRGQIMTPNEVRVSMYDLNPIEGGDSFAAPSTPIAMSFSHTPIKKNAVTKAINLTLIKAAIDEHNTAFDRNLEVFKLHLVPYFKHLSDKVQAIVSSNSIQKGMAEEAIGSLDAESKRLMKELIDANIETSQDFIQTNYKRQTGKAISTEVQSKINAQMKKHIAKWSEESANSITETNQRRLSTLFKTAQTNNWDVSQIRKGVSEIFEGTSREPYSHAQMIARTENLHIANLSRQETAIENGFVKKTWLATTDERSRHWHNGVMNGVSVAIDEPFIVGGIEMQYPGDPAGGPNNNCNCRCAFVES
jgi:post-segregation antitoxin (ccd killing protein)